MAIETTIKSIKQNGGEKLLKRDQALIREALEETEFEYDDFIWVTKDDGVDIMYWITYNLDTVFSAQLLLPLVEKELELKADGLNDNRVRNLTDEALVDILFDLRFAKGTGNEDMYHRMLSKNGFIVFDASVQIERICHTVKTEMEFRMQE